VVGVWDVGLLVVKMTPERSADKPGGIKPQNHGLMFPKMTLMFLESISLSFPRRFENQ
jgi:hypothetical protein